MKQTKTYPLHLGDMPFFYLKMIECYTKRSEVFQ